MRPARHAAMPRAWAGFTMIELVTVMILVGLLAVFVVPRFSSSSGFKAVAFHDQVVAALRYAQKSAVSHRRLVCATISSNSVTLNIAAANPAGACGSATLNGPDGSSAIAESSDALIAGSVGPIYFQPSGFVTSSSGTVTDYAIAISGASTVTVTGATGHVE